MKQYYIPFIFTLSIITWIGCSHQEEPAINPETELEIHGFSLSIIGTEENMTRAESDYAANSEDDPTSAMETRTEWKLHIQLYYDDAPYNDGEAICTWNSSDSIWLPTSPLFFPNYKTQQVSAILYPQGWDENTAFITDQQEADDLLLQDILSTAAEAKITPAKKPVITLEHHYSMLDFRLAGIDEDAIAGIKVLTYDEQNNPTEYQPYEVGLSDPDSKEYLLILPVATKNPVVILTTVQGIEYAQLVNINEGTLKNTCYCFTLNGLELELSPISVKNWATGVGLPGENTAPTAYPTFRGPKDSSCRLYFDNGLTQDITFNSQGEWTGKPVGRTITEVRVLETINNEIIETKKYILPAPKALRDMIINLTDYIALATPIQ